MEERKTLDYGRKYRVGNFTVLKYTKSLSKAELRSLRDEAGLPRDIQKHLQRGGLPFIKVEAVSGLWAVEFMVGMGMYALIDSQLEDSEINFIHLFTSWLTDTTVAGDETYVEEKMKALKGYLDRLKAVGTDEESEEAIEDVKRDEKARQDILEMADRLRKEAEDDK